jgi:Leucine-rich repeat (LRR) protein
MTVFNTIVQIPSLKQLKLCSNRLEGNVPDSIGGLATLEILDLHENIITHLPDEVHNLRLLSVLNVSSNKLSSIPLNHLGNLTELLASKNKLSGSLFPSGVSSMQNLRTLDVMGNSITELSGGVDLGLPALKLLVITANRVTHLPDVSTWQELLTISAEDNKINAFPAGLVSLKNIRHLDFTGNDLKVLDEHLADMESLQVLSISNNPLREKKFLSMTTDDIKRDLRARLTPKEEASDIHDGAELLSNLEVESTVNGTGTPVKNGVLDLANKQLLTLSSTQLSKIAAQCSVNNLEIHHNSLSSFPLEVSIFSGSLISLNLAHNDLRSETLFSKDLVLPALRSLNISSNSLKSLEPILEHLQSPVLDIINVSCNRITVFPSLRDYFPALQTVLASDNIIQELTVEAVRGLHICDVSRNDIAHLPPRLGLLGNDGGLRRLEVQGNKFRVPRWNIVDKGTDVLLSWLKDKIPVDEAEDDVD